MSKCQSDLVASVLPGEVRRHDLFDRIVKVGAAGALAAFLLQVLASQVLADNQDHWYRCSRCYSMFFDGYPNNKGRCPAGGSHAAERFEFVLPYKVSASKTAQDNWRFCNKCNALFFDGYPDNKGRCPGEGGHVAAGFNFVLPHDIRPTAKTQNHWRFCNKCNTMFDNDPAVKGRCPAGGGHVAAGYDFVLTYRAAGL
jgi:hypothetical protein